MTAPEAAATRRMVWYTIANAVGDSTLPEPSHLSFHPGGERSIVSMTFDRVDSAEKWARFLGWRPDDPVEITARADQSITYFADKRGWRWHLNYNPIAEREAAGTLSDRHMSGVGA